MIFWYLHFANVKPHFVVAAATFCEKRLERPMVAITFVKRSIFLIFYDFGANTLWVRKRRHVYSCPYLQQI